MRPNLHLAAGDPARPLPAVVGKMSAVMAETTESQASSERPAAGEAELRGAIRNVRRAALLAVVVLVVSTLGYMVLEG